MLSELSIQNFALIEQGHLRFNGGLNVLTGETGAGKSIILNAIHLLLGGRASQDLIRKGETSACVEARFVFGPEDLKDWLLERIEELGIERDEEDSETEVIIRRVITLKSESRVQSRIYINGQMVTRASLLKFSEGFIDLCGQREHQILLKAKNHRNILDRLMDQEKSCIEMQQSHKQLKKIYKEWKYCTENRTEILQRQDYLQFQIQEINEIAPQPNEDKTIQETLKKLSNVEELQNISSHVENVLEGHQHGIISALSSAISKCQQGEKHDPHLSDITKLLQEAKINCEEAQRDLMEFQQSLEHNPEKISELDQRLHALTHLQRKHGSNLQEVLQKLLQMTEELDSITLQEEGIPQMVKSGQEALLLCYQNAKQLHEKRLKTAKRLAKIIRQELIQLSMQETEFKVDLNMNAKENQEFPCTPDEAGLNAFGSEDIRFLLAPNKGEGFHPLDQIASGGELSRVLLALKCILSPAEEVGTYLFDEIDAGIGGRTANAVGQKLKTLSKKRQVLCITHLPQIAAFADHHIRVSKESQKGRTQTRLKPLGQEDRIEELSRMLGGDFESPTSRAHARQLLNLSH